MPVKVGDRCLLCLPKVCCAPGQGNVGSWDFFQLSHQTVLPKWSPLPGKESFFPLRAGVWSETRLKLNENPDWNGRNWLYPLMFSSPMCSGWARCWPCTVQSKQKVHASYENISSAFSWYEKTFIKAVTNAVNSNWKVNSCGSTCLLLSPCLLKTYIWKPKQMPFALCCHISRIYSGNRSPALRGSHCPVSGLNQFCIFKRHKSFKGSQGWKKLYK